MARGRSIVETQDQQALPSVEPDAAAVGAGFGAEFRELARQRRFVRSDADAATPPADSSADWRAHAAAPSRTRRSAAPLPAAPSAAPVTPAPTASGHAVLSHQPASSLDARISDDQRATLRELARMSNQLVQSREELATLTERASQLEATVAQSNERLAAADERMLAARVLVQDAQRTAHELSERCTWLEARSETLQEALELAVNASWMTRWNWRREQRARARN